MEANQSNGYEGIHRLEKQGKYLSGLTRDLLVRAGIEPGMRLLDFGAGAGDVGILASELVGPRGQVIAIDRSSGAIELAKIRMESLKIQNVLLINGDESIIPEAMGDRKFDALLSRLVFFHRLDPIETFCRLAEYVRPGGIVAFQEIDMDCKSWSNTPLPLAERIWALIVQTVKQGGMVNGLIAKLIQAFDKTGIKARRIVQEGLIETAPESQCFDFLGSLVRTWMPLMLNLGLSDEKELDIETLPDRMKAEAVLSEAIFIPFYLISAFGHKKGSRVNDLNL